MNRDWEPSSRYDEWPGCLFCAHYRAGKCAAYPERIPQAITFGAVDHFVPRPGQVGEIVFEPMDFEVFHRTGKRVPEGQAEPKQEVRSSQTP